MNNLIIFDLDGVLIDSRDMHYEALNRALEKVDPKYIITRDEHLRKTSKKQLWKSFLTWSMIMS